MLMRILPLLTAAGALALSACAPTTQTADGGATPRRCFSASTVFNFNAADDNIVYVRAPRNAVFQLRAVGFCQDLDWAQRLAIAPIGGGSQLCPGDEASLAYFGGGASQRGPCRVRVERQLTEAEVAALPSRHRP
jgi:hypothetical protein